MDKWLHCSFIWDGTTHPCLNFNGSLSMPPLKWAHAWVIISHTFAWIWLPVHAHILTMCELIFVSKRGPWKPIHFLIERHNDLAKYRGLHLSVPPSLCFNLASGSATVLARSMSLKERWINSMHKKGASETYTKTFYQLLNRASETPFDNVWKVLS